MSVCVCVCVGWGGCGWVWEPPAQSSCCTGPTPVCLLHEPKTAACMSCIKQLPLAGMGSAALAAAV